MNCFIYKYEQILSSSNSVYTATLIAISLEVSTVAVLDVGSEILDLHIIHWEHTRKHHKAFLPKLRDKIRNGEPGFEATLLQLYNLPKFPLEKIPEEAKSIKTSQPYTVKGFEYDITIISPTIYASPQSCIQLGPLAQT